MSQAELPRSRLQALHDAMVAHVDHGEVPGLVTVVSRDGASAVEAIGRQSFDGEAMQPDTIFRIASLSKPVAAAATMVLVEDGRLDLNEPVDRLLPELANRRVLKRLDGPIDDTEAARRPITVDDLLTLRMGTGAIMAPGRYPIIDAMTEKGVAVGPELPDAPTPDAWIAGLGRLPLMRQPGEAWLYDTGLTVLGVLIARAAGQKLEEFLDERIFAPLGMHDTGFSVPAGKLGRLSTAYRRDPQTGAFTVFDPAGTTSRFSRGPGFPSASGGLVSTAQDYLAFAAMMLNQGTHQGRRVLTERSVALMTTDHITPEQKAVSPFVPGFWDRTGWGYGLSVIHHHELHEPRGCGWLGGYGTAAFWDRASGVITILLTQRMMDSPEPPAVYADFWRTAYAVAQD
jgi:CubicO group peptidase (beta-lactamase class C family)